MAMEYKAVTSSSVLQIGYDVESHTLEVLFASQRRYAYDNVPKEVADSFLNAKSKGLFVAESLRDKYTYRCLNPPPPKEPKDAEVPKEDAPKPEAKTGKRKLKGV